MNFKSKLLLLFVFIVSSCSGADQSTEQAVENNVDEAVGIVVTANPVATEAGLEILRAGGSAVDAAVAVEAVLGLVEPQSSGLAGGGFLVHYDATSKDIVVFDGRETAPMGATKELFIDDQGNRLSFSDAKNSGLSIGAPGAVALFNLAHNDYGKLPWKDLFAPALRHSIDGFAVSPRMHDTIVTYAPNIPKTTEEGPIDAYNYLFNDDGMPLAAGHILKNPEYAKTLNIIAADPAAFYNGKIATDIAAAAQEMPNGGTLSASDIAGYSARKLAPYCSEYRNTTLCGSPLPSSWVSISMVMGILNEAPEFSPEGADDPQNWTLLAEALRITYADNNQYIADDRFVEVPIKGLMNKDYIKERAKLISREGANSVIEAGDPWAYQDEQAAAFGKDATYDTSGTTHFVIIDAVGNVVSMTATVEGYFGSLRMAGGMFLNNQMTDFSFEYEDADGKPIANAVAPGKRPRSSMSPTIVMDENRDFLMAVGSPGGRSIISYVAKTVVGIMNWGLTPQEAINLPNIVARTELTRIENSASPEIIDGLRNFGFQVKATEGEISGLSSVVKTADGTLLGGVDQRREGTVGILYASELK